MKTLLKSIALIAAISCSAAAFAAEESHDLAAKAEHAIAGGHFPVIKPKEESWSFAGPFGKYDKGQLQRGLKVYKEVCSACHSMNLVSFRTLGDLGYSDEQVKAFAAEYEVQDGPNADGEMYNRKAVPSDHFPRHSRTMKRLPPLMVGLLRPICRCLPRRAAWSAGSRNSSST